MQRDTTRHRFIAMLASHIGTVMDEAGIKHKKHRVCVWGGGAGSLVAMFVKCIACLCWYFCKSSNVSV